MKLLVSFGIPLLLALLALRVMLITNFAYLDENNVLKFDKLEVLAALPEAQINCTKKLLSRNMPLDAEDVIYYDDDIILFASGQLKYAFLYGKKGATTGGKIFIFDAAKNLIFPIEAKGLKTHAFFAPHGMYYSKDTERLYIINHFAKGVNSGIEVFSVVKEEGARYPSLEWIGKILAGFHFGMINDLVEGSDNELYITQWRSNPVPEKGLRGDTSLSEKITEVTSTLRSLSSYFYNTGFLYCRFDIKKLASPQTCVKANRKIKLGMANGIAIDKNSSNDHNILYVNDALADKIQVFKVPKQIKVTSFYQQNAIRNQVKHIDTIELIEGVDNIYYDETRQILIGGGVPLKYFHLQHSINPEGGVKVPGSMIVIDPTTKESKRIMYHKGDKLAALSSCLYTTSQNDKKIVCGSPYDNGLLVCDLD